MQKLRALATANFILAALVVFAWIAYEKWRGLPIDEICMGFTRDGRPPPMPAWATPALMEAGLLVLFCLRDRIDQGIVRFLAAGISGWMLTFSLVLPTLGTQVGASDKVVLWYFGLSNIAYGII